MDLIDLAEASRIFGITPQTLRNYIREGKLAEHRFGRKFRVSRQEVNDLLNAPLKPRNVDGTRVITIANQKGGTGKTTTATCIGWYLAEMGRTLLIDMDPQANLTQTFGIKPEKQEKSLYEVLMKGMPAREVIHHVGPPPKSLDLLGSSIDLADVVREAYKKVSPATMLRQVLRPILTDYEFVVIDCPPSLDWLTLNALAVATEVIVPVEMGAYAARGTLKLSEVITDVREVNPDLPPARFLAVQVRSDNLSDAVVGELWKTYRGRLFGVTISKSNKVGEAQLAYKPLPTFAPDSDPAKDYRNLVLTEILHG